ncbi:protein of unknown function [Hyphomicrobium sp. 1Nfss2.1]
MLSRPPRSAGWDTRYSEIGRNAPIQSSSMKPNDLVVLLHMHPKLGCVALQSNMTRAIRVTLSQRYVLKANLPFEFATI